MDGVATAGSIVGIYPGLVYLPEMFQTEADLKAVFVQEDGSENDLAMARYDETIIDGRKSQSDAVPPNPFGSSPTSCAPCH